MQPRTSTDISRQAALASLAALAVALLCVGAGLAPLEQAELRVSDLRFWYRGSVAPSTNVVIVAIDEPSLARHGRWPWPRETMAALVESLTAARPSVLALDVGFLDRTTPAADASLAGVLATTSCPVVLSYYFHTDTRQLPDGPPTDLATRLAPISRSVYPAVEHDGDGPPPPLLQALAPEPPLAEFMAATPWAGFATSITDADGVFRRMPLAMQCDGRTFPSLAVLALWHHLRRPLLVLRTGPEGAQAIELGELRVPCDPLARLPLNYLAPPGAFTQLSASAVLDGAVPPETLRGKAVFIGGTAPGVRDYCNTPFSPFHPGVELHATVVDNVLSGRMLEPPPLGRLLDLLITTLLGLGLTLVLRRTGAVAGLAATLGMAVLYLGGTWWLFVAQLVPLPLVAPAGTLALVYGTTMVVRYVLEERQRRTIEGAFGRYVSPVVIDQMLADPTRLRLGGEERELTVLFSDLAGFTSTSERLGPTRMIELLSEYFEAMTARVYAEEGMLKEYVGDELMAMFGAPLEQPDHAVRACRAALAMRNELARLRDDWTARGLPPLSARTGVNTGRVVVGNLGSSYRFAYGALGDEVNLGSRLEGLNKAYGTRLIIGQNTAEGVGDHFHLRELDSVRVVGKERAVRIFELLEPVDAQLPAPTKEACIRYGQGLAAYREGRFAEARALFEQALIALPGDGPSRVMAARCEAYLATPPPPGWDGVYEATSK